MKQILVMIIAITVLFTACSSGGAHTGSAPASSNAIESFDSDPSDDSVSATEEYTTALSEAISELSDNYNVDEIYAAAIVIMNIADSFNLDADELNGLLSTIIDDQMLIEFLNRVIVDGYTPAELEALITAPETKDPSTKTKTDSESDSSTDPSSEPESENPDETESDPEPEPLSVDSAKEAARDLGRSFPEEYKAEDIYATAQTLLDLSQATGMNINALVAQFHSRLHDNAVRDYLKEIIFDGLTLPELQHELVDDDDDHPGRGKGNKKED